MTVVQENGTFEKVTVNLAGEIEQVKFMGDDYIVAPMSMIVEGVLNGSRGPYFYPSETIEENPEAWNGMPIVLNHPQDSDGNYVSARYPDVLEKHWLGWVFNSSASDGKLTSKGYFNRERLKNDQPLLFQKLMNKEKVELSTGLFAVDIEESEGVYNSVKYQGIVKSLAPDHLAILPNEKGACSVESGCGVNNAESGNSILEAIKKLLGVKPKETKSLTQIQDEIRELIKDNLDPYEYVWIADMYPDYVIYSNDTKYFKQGYTVSDDGAVALSGSATEVERKVVYNKEGDHGGSPKSKSQDSGEPQMPLSKEDRAKLIDAIVGNCSCEKTKEPLFNDEDKKTLEGFSDAQLEALANAAQKPEEENQTAKVTTVNKATESAEVSEEEWLKTAPASVRETLANVRKREEEYKKSLANKIKENENCRMTDELLMSKPVEELENLVEMLGVGNAAKEGETKYYGAGAAPYGIVPASRKESVLNQDSRMKSPIETWAASNPSLSK